MKSLLLRTVFIAALIYPQSIYSQKTSICETIGKNLNAVIKQYGKPVHHDKSDPNFECVFYQSKSTRMVFIADKTGVYQIQADYYFTSKAEADKAMDGFMNDCTAKNMLIDTVKVNEYKITTHGVKMNFTLFENSYTKKYEIKFKADKSETK
jgi:hypothetical protein